MSNRSNRSNPTSDVGVEANYIEPVAISNGGVESNSAEVGPPVLEFVRVNRDIEFRLEGGTIDENSVSLFMRITDSNGMCKYYYKKSPSDDVMMS